jgi:Integrase core domain
MLNRELFLSIDELRYVVDRWRMDYTHYRPHGSLDYMAPAAFAAMRLEQGSGSHRLIQDKENCCEILSRWLGQYEGAGQTELLFRSKPPAIIETKAGKIIIIYSQNLKGVRILFTKGEKNEIFNKSDTIIIPLFIDFFPNRLWSYVSKINEHK